MFVRVFIYRGWELGESEGERERERTGGGGGGGMIGQSHLDLQYWIFFPYHGPAHHYFFQSIQTFQGEGEGKKGKWRRREMNERVGDNGKECGEIEKEGERENERGEANVAQGSGHTLPFV